MVEKKESFGFSVLEFFGDNRFSLSFFSEEREKIGHINAGGLYCDVHIPQIAIGFGVNEKFQGQGFGDKLLKRFLEVCQEHGFKRIGASVRITNISSFSVFEKNKFKLISVKNGILNYIRHI